MTNRLQVDVVDRPLVDIDGVSTGFRSTSKGVANNMASKAWSTM